jgi:carbon monoxide dehydrogenase subunit G
VIETEQSIVIAAPMTRVWDFARDIRAWAKLMPGLKDCEVADEDHSHWTLKIGAGALVRTVKVTVQVERWAGPEEVDFSYTLAGDPVQGGGTYRATVITPNETQIALGIRVAGTGPMAPMWEAMGRPLLPKFARGFAEQFKAEIEQSIAAGPELVVATARPPASRFARILDWVRKLFGRTGNAAQ